MFKFKKYRRHPTAGDRHTQNTVFDDGYEDAQFVDYDSKQSKAIFWTGIAIGFVIGMAVMGFIGAVNL